MHKDKSGYGSKTKAGIDRAFCNQDSIKYTNGESATKITLWHSKRERRRRKYRTTVRTPAHMTYVKPITENEAYENMSEGREKREINAGVVGDGMRDV